MNVFVLTGAGISAESGLATFRGKDGLWEGHDPFELATPAAFRRDPVLVHSFYNVRRAKLVSVDPNAAHQALARLEVELPSRGGSQFLCTQNVDDLHERAGSHDVVHMHGELRKARCTLCQTISSWDDDMTVGSVCPACGRAGALRPHIVWFGEVPLEMDRIDAALNGADMFVAIGTSGAVYPAAGFVEKPRALGARTIEINLQASDSDMFDERHIGAAGEVVPAWVELILQNVSRSPNPFTG